MYAHTREVFSGLALSLGFIVATGVIALVDPFKNGVPWVNWLTMAAISTITVFISTVITANNKREGEFWGYHGAMLGMWLVLGGFGCAMMADATTGVQAAYHTLVWTTFAIPFIVLPISSLTQYLVVGAKVQGEVRPLRAAS